MFSREKYLAIRTGLIAIAGCLFGVVVSKVSHEKEYSLMLCQTRLALIAQKHGGALAAVTLKDTPEEAVIGIITQNGRILVRLTETNGNFLLEEQCIRPDGHKVLMETQKID